MGTGERNGTCGFLLLLGFCACLLVFISTQGTANAEWPADPSMSLPVCNAVGSQYGPQLVKVADGYVVVWQDERRVSRDIYADRGRDKGVLADALI